jgi:hypothetical protein
MQPFVALISLLALLAGGAAAGTVGAPPESGRLNLNPVIDHTLAGLRSGSIARVSEMGSPQSPFAGLAAGGAAAYGSGTVLHAEGPTSMLEMGLSQASFSTAALPAGQDELAHPLPALAAGTAKARGRALELHDGGSDTTPDEVKPAEAVAPPSKEPVSTEQEVALMKLFKANSLAASAGARAVWGGCVIGSNIAYGIGSATDTRLADFKNDPKSDAPLLALHTEDPPPRATSQSQSRTFLAPAADGGPGFGFVAQTRQTIAPITLAEGTDNQLLVELGGEWVLSVFTDGKQSKATFGPDPNSVQGKDDKWPVLRIVQGRGDKKKLFALTLGDLTGENGKQVVGLDGGSVTVGENPRALGDENGVQNPISTPTFTAAAADVVRISSGAGEIRIGHMEAAVAVPSGGVQCPGIAMAKRSVPETVGAGNNFTWDVTVSNPNDCMLRDVKLVDVATPTKGVRFEVKSTSPGSTQAPDGTITFDSLDQIPLGAERSVRIEAVIPDDATAGAIANSVSATGTCSGVNRTGAANSTTVVQAAEHLSLPTGPGGIGVGGSSRSSAAQGEVRSGPAVLPATQLAPAQNVNRRAQANPPGVSRLARTGGLYGAGLAGPLLMLGGFLWRRGRRPRS